MLGPGVDASWGGDESQDLGAGVLVGRSFWGQRSGLNTPWHRHLAAHELVRN